MGDVVLLHWVSEILRDMSLSVLRSDHCMVWQQSLIDYRFLIGVCTVGQAADHIVVVILISFEIASCR